MATKGRPRTGLSTDEMINVRVPKQVKRQLNEAAKRRHVPLSWFVRGAIEVALDKPEIQEMIMLREG